MGIESAGNTSVDAADSIDHALSIYDLSQERVLLSCTGTDAGGGGTREDLVEKLNNKRVQCIATHTSSTCNLHGMNLCLSSPILLLMGDGGLLKRTAMQCLHTAYNLLQQFKANEWLEIWQVLTGVNLVKQIKSPILTRWEYVGETCSHILEHKDNWMLVAKHIVNVQKSGSTRHTIASYLVSYLNEPMLIAHLHFIDGYIKSWWDPHFQWMKRVDKKTKTKILAPYHMPVEVIAGLRMEKQGRLIE